MSYRHSLMGVALLVCPGFWMAAAAQPAEERVIEDRLRLDIGVFPASFATEARVDANSDDLGTTFSGEDDFGLDSSRVLPQTELTLLPGTRHLIRLSSLRAQRSGSKVLTRDIEYEGEVFESGDLVDSTLDVYLTGITYGYQFLRRPRGQLAATFGVQIGDVKTNAEVRGQGIGEENGAVAPLPMIGLEGGYDLNQRWSVEGRFQYTTNLSYDLIEASMLDARVAVTWRLNPHMAFGLAYRKLTLQAESFDDDSAGLVDLTISGPMVFVRASL